MKTLIVEDNFISRQLLQQLLSPYGPTDQAVDGREAIQAFELARAEKKPYDLICLDIMMPNLDGMSALKTIRQLEKEAGVAQQDETRVIMISALDDPKSVIDSYYRSGATSYLAKPINIPALLEELGKLGLI